jgi:hypothetical protein
VWQSQARDKRQKVYATLHVRRFTRAITDTPTPRAIHILTTSAHASQRNVLKTRGGRGGVLGGGVRLAKATGKETKGVCNVRSKEADEARLSSLEGHHGHLSFPPKTAEDVETCLRTQYHAHLKLVK